MKRLSVLWVFVCLAAIVMAQRVSIVTGKKASAREQYAAEYLQKKLQALGYTFANKKADCKITLQNVSNGPVEGYTISKDKKGITVSGNDATGVIYGCVELAERIKSAGSLDGVKPTTEQPDMVMRGTCIGLQKTVYLPGHGVYEYPYTPENFPWFYDKAEWVKYLDMLVENKMNSLYLWNGHPFASLVKLKDYPFAL